jgi:hypothetical protein
VRGEGKKAGVGRRDAKENHMSAGVGWRLLGEQRSREMKVVLTLLLMLLLASSALQIHVKRLLPLFISRRLVSQQH